MKVAVVTCYHMPDYVRARTLRTALTSLPGMRVRVIKNRRTSVLRYPEVLWRLWQLKRQEHPDAYVLTFRGQEILPFVLLIAGNKPVIFDEFIVPIAYATDESHHRTLAIRVKYALARLSEPFYRLWLHRCAVIIADTQAHAELSARVSRTNLSKYSVVPVGADERVFHPAKTNVRETEKFTVFYYSSGMQPLHGIPVVLAAAKQLKDRPEIEFIILGGKRPLARAVEEAARAGAHVRYERWIPFEELLAIIHDASLCLGGPFGNTPQSNRVITGKTFQFLAAEAPVVVGASETTSEYFRDKQNALVVPQGDPEALARTIKWAAAHPAELGDIAENGRRLYEKQFSNEAIARQLQSIVEVIS